MTIDYYIDYLKKKGLQNNSICEIKKILQALEKYLDYSIIKSTKEKIEMYLYSFQLSEWTIFRKYYILYNFFDFCQKQNFIKQNPMINIKQLKYPKRNVKYLKQQEVDNLFQKLLYEEKKSIIWQRNITIVKLLYYTGIKRGELYRLNVLDIDFKNKQICVINNNHKKRYIPLASSIIITLKEWINTLLSLSLNTSALFITLTINYGYGQRLRLESLRDIMKKTFKKMGLHGYNNLKLRYTFAKNLLCKGLKAKDVARLLGCQRKNIYDFKKILMSNNLGN